MRAGFPALTATCSSSCLSPAATARAGELAATGRGAGSSPTSMTTPPRARRPPLRARPRTAHRSRGSPGSAPPSASGPSPSASPEAAGGAACGPRAGVADAGQRPDLRAFRHRCRSRISGATAWFAGAPASLAPAPHSRPSRAACGRRRRRSPANYRLHPPRRSSAVPRPRWTGPRGRCKTVAARPWAGAEERGRCQRRGRCRRQGPPSCRH
mmetsp:Transcript_3181/g.9082  ORF Transcript_3181/g.9082 Transcript_3181/m.9082 type:complete len:212 (-) Transcript_3181:320-955(-)